jgi:hypothetical protein
MSSELEPDKIPLALWVCSRNWRVAAKNLGTLMSRLQLIRMVRRHGPVVLGKAWMEYLRAFSALPKFHRNPMPKATRDAPMRRPSGTPILLRVRLFAMKELNLQPDALDDMVMLDLFWLWCAHLEDEGIIAIQNDADEEFDEWCEEQEKNGQPFPQRPCP